MTGDRPSPCAVAVVLGCGEVGSAVAWTLDDAGLAVVLVDEVDPAWHRRGMAYTNAWYIGNAELDGKGACFCASVKSVPSVLARGMIAATTWSWRGVAGALQASVLVDTRLHNRRGTEMLRGRVPVAIGIGPGFVANENVDVAIEDRHDGERVSRGEAGNPSPSRIDGDLGPSDPARCVVTCTRYGRFATGLRIGEFVQAGQTVGGVGSDAVCAPASGVLLGLTARGARVEPRDVLVEVDSSAAAHECFGMGTGPRHVAQRVVSALSGYPMSARRLMVWD